MLVPRQDSDSFGGSGNSGFCSRGHSCHLLLKLQWLSASLTRSCGLLILSLKNETCLFFLKIRLLDRVNVYQPGKRKKQQLLLVLL